MDEDFQINDDNPNKVEEYFKTKEALKTLREDLKEHKENNEDFKQLTEIMKEVKQLRDKIKNNEEISIITQKAETLKERMELLKEIIKTELLESAQEEVKMDGRKLKIVQVLKEMKDELA